MSHSTIQYVNPPAKIWTSGSAGTLATARTPSTAGKPATAGPPATAYWKGTSETLQNLGYTRNVSNSREKPPGT
jgi:hypothetical protein